MSEALMRDIVHLSEEIGPRGSCTEGEELAADYVTQRFLDLGYEPLWHPFLSARSSWWPFALSTGVVLLAAGLFIAVPVRAASVIAAVVIFVTLRTTTRELSHKPNWLRRVLPKGESRNVVAVASPTGQVKRRVLISSHLDTHRTPLAHRSTGWILLFRRLIKLGVGGYVLLLGLAVTSAAVDPASPIGQVCRLAALAPAAVTLLVQFLSLQADTTDYSPGAIDNASGVAVLLSVAERLRKQPLAQTEVWLAATGCQEVGAYGAAALIEDLSEELAGAVYLVVDKVGAAGPCYLTAEKRLRTYTCDPHLVALAEAVVAEHPRLAIRPAVYRNTYTEGAVGITAGLPTLTLLGLDLTGWVPHLHQATDTAENIHIDVVERSEEFVWHWLGRFDADGEYTVA